MSYISKSLEMVVAQVTRKYPVVLVTGPRQVFKMMQGFRNLWEAVLRYFP